MGERRLTRNAKATGLAAEKGCAVKPDRTLWSWVVPSPLPRRIFEIRPMKEGGEVENKSEEEV